MLVTTKNGTVFRLNLKDKTWERVSKTEQSGPIRSESGTFESFRPLAYGHSLVLNCPPLSEGAVGRMIMTSPVVKVETECWSDYASTPEGRAEMTGRQEEPCTTQP